MSENMVNSLYNAMPNISNVLSWNSDDNNTLKNLANNDVLKIGNLLSGIFSKNDSKEFIDPPRLVVVGTQSSGKSSLLNGVISMDIMPIGKNMVTRTPLNLQLTQTNNESYAEFVTIRV